MREFHKGHKEVLTSLRKGATATVDVPVAERVECWDSGCGPTPQTMTLLHMERKRLLEKREAGTGRKWRSHKKIREKEKNFGVSTVRGSRSH
jgi:hypothetical protein